MHPFSVDEWMDHFVSEVAPDNDPRDVPSASERKAVSDYLHGKISVGEAAFAYTRDTISENTSGDVWYLIYHIAHDLPETQDRLIELIRAISALPNESHISGKVQSWGPATLADLHGDLRDHWDGTTAQRLMTSFTDGVGRSIKCNQSQPCYGTPSRVRRPDDIHCSSSCGRPYRNRILHQSRHVDCPGKRGVCAGPGYLPARYRSVPRMGGTRRLQREPQRVREPWPSSEKGTGGWRHEPLAVLEVSYGSAWR